MRIKKRFVWSLVVVLSLAVAFAGAPATEAEETLCIPLGTIVIEAPPDVEAQRSAVDFPHGRHFGFACTECHHQWDGTDEKLGCATSGCHDLTAAPGPDSETPAHRYFKNAYHDSCIGCHQARKVQNKKAEMANALDTVQLPTGPTGCVLCHPR